MLKVAMIGFGGIAHSAHIKPHLELEKKGVSKLIAVCDICAERFNEKIAINIGGSDVTLSDSVKKYADWKEMLEKEDVDVVDICVPTFLHKEVSIGALESGHHVICEKPMSLTYDSCKKMCETAKRVGKKFMIGQSVRFSAAMVLIKKIIDEGVYGKVKSAMFHRLSAPPKWGWENWYMDYNRSKSCIMDLHIHDIDYIRHVFGEPKGVSCHTADVYAGKDIAHSRLFYDDFSVMAIGDWSREGLPFQSGCTIAFENATLVRDGNTITISPRGEESFVAEYEPNNSHMAEIEYFMDCVENDKEITLSVPQSTALSVKLINTLIESSNENGAFVPFTAE